MGFKNEFFEDGKKLTHDPDREAILFHLNGSVEKYVELFSLLWKDKVIYFYARMEIVPNQNDKPSIIWHYSKLNIPQELEDSENEIAGAIGEALQVYGLFHGHKYIKESRIKYKPPGRQAS